MSSGQPPNDAVVGRTRAWVEHAVIGLNLCPFAKAVQLREQIRYVATPATDADALLQVLCVELQRLAAADPAALETTLLIHPQVMNDFMDFNDFLEAADGAVDALGYTGVLQVASFHPSYQFEGTSPNDITNVSNRSPFPTLHLLRETSIDRAIQMFGETDDIFRNNMRTLRALGPEGWAAVRARIDQAADPG